MTKHFQIYGIFTFLLLLLWYKPAAAQEKNIVFHKPVTATSEDPANPASNAVDGKISRTSKWQASSSKAPHILEIDLQKYYEINEIRVHSGIMDSEKKPDEMTQAAGFWSVKNFKLQYWDDANWSDFPKAEVHENRLTNVIFKFNPTVTTFRIRLVCDDGEPISVMEIEAFGTEALNMPQPPALSSGISKPKDIKGAVKAGITVNDKITGRSMKFVGYNQGYYFPGSNVSGWLEYSDVNSVRVWATLNAFVPEADVQMDKGIATVEEFDRRKKELRANPGSDRFIRWNDLNAIYNRADFSSTNGMVYSYAISELKRLGIQTILQVGSTDFEDNWANKWKQWQRYYALAYYSAKTGDVTMFAMQNEPNHRNSGPMKLDQWIMGMQITSDAVHAAIEDVNKKYGKNLEAKFVGPVTAGQNTDWWAAVAKAIRTDYHGKAIDKDLLDIFSTHSYNSPAAGYISRINNIRKILTDNHPEGKALPVVYTEIGRWMNAYLIDKEETMDSPSLFTEWAGMYSNNMKNGGYGMWAFKFANTASGTYPRGIKSGHHYIWQGKRIIEDAYKNLALNKPVKGSTSTGSLKFVTDGDKSDRSAWVSDSASAEKWIEIDLGMPQKLGAAVTYTGSAYGVYTSPDRIRNFKLQYLEAGKWKDIPGASEKNCRYAQVFSLFESPVTTSRVRFISPDEGVLKVREIKLFAWGDGPSSNQCYDVSGIQRTGEVVRLFAKGFKDERPLLETLSSVNDPDLDSYTSFDPQTGNYYMWLVQRGHFQYDLAVDISKLKVVAGSPVTVETVNPDYYGEVTQVIDLPNNRSFNLSLPPQSVMLLTIPSGTLKKTAVLSSAGATVSAGKNSLKNYGREKQMQVQLDAAAPENNKVSYIYFKLPGIQTEKIKRAILSVSGCVDKDDRPFRLHVYGVPSGSFDQQKLNWLNVAHLDKKEALVKDIGRQVFVAGELAFDLKEKFHHLDVTGLLKRHPSKDMSFILVRETRQLGDDEDKGRTVMIHSAENGKMPVLEFWSASE